MTKIKKYDPELYNEIKKRQVALEHELTSSIKIERKCPYCNSTIATIYQGTHAGEKIKCPVCKEFVYFAPVNFRLAR